MNEQKNEKTKITHYVGSGIIVGAIIAGTITGITYQTKLKKERTETENEQKQHELVVNELNTQRKKINQELINTKKKNEQKNLMLMTKDNTIDSLINMMNLVEKTQHELKNKYLIEQQRNEQLKILFEDISIRYHDMEMFLKKEKATTTTLYDSINQQVKKILELEKKTLEYQTTTNKLQKHLNHYIINRRFVGPRGQQRVNIPQQQRFYPESRETVKEFRDKNKQLRKYK